MEQLFKTIASELRRNPFESIIAFLMILILIAVWHQSGTIVEELLKPKTHTAETFAVALEASNNINKILQEAPLPAEIHQFHNGSYDLSGLPFTQVRLTYREGNFASRPISTMSGILKLMWKDFRHPKCVVVTRDNADPMYSMTTKFELMCPITSTRDYPIGYIVLKSNSDPSKWEDYLSTKANKIGGYLERG